MEILSTKTLTNTQKSLLANYKVVEKPLIEIQFGEYFCLSESVEYSVFTSSNAVKSVFGVHKNNPDLFKKVYCVGIKTKSLLENFGLEVLEVADNALELAEVLVTKKMSEIHFFCGNLRNNDLPTVMAENGVLVTEYMVYKTELIKHTFKNVFNAVLFFSPSGVKSYVHAYNNCDVAAITIGVTTATEALDAFEKVYIADTTSVESVIEKLKEIINS